MKSLLLGVLGLVALSGCSAAAASVPEVASPPSATTTKPVSRIDAAATKCRISPVNVKDSGTTLLLDTKGKDDSSGDSMTDVACVLQALAVPDRVVAAMDATRALDGVQRESWDGIEARWSYHPDSGVNLILADTRA